MRLGFVRPLYAKTGDRTIYPIPKKLTYLYLEWLVDVAKKRYCLKAQYGTSDKGHWVQLGIAGRRYSLLAASEIRRDILMLVAKNIEDKPLARAIALEEMFEKKMKRLVKSFEESLTEDQMKLYKELRFIPALWGGPRA